MTAPRVAIIADDLTGAMDVAGPLAERGLDTRAVASVEHCRPESLAGAEVVSVNADTRHLPPSQAASRIKSTFDGLIDRHTEILIKKIDSTLRGNVVAETLALMEASGRGLAVVAPAFPSQGRTVVGGVVHVSGVALAQTNFARDALTPPPLEPLHLLFERAAPALRVRLLAREQKWSAHDLASPHILVVDAGDDEDLRATVTSVGSRLVDAVLVGSSGIAQAVGDVHFSGPGRTGPRPVAEGAVLFVVGSRAEQSARQVQALIGEQRAAVFPAPNGRVEIRAVVEASSDLLVIQAVPRADGREGDAVEVAKALAESAARILAGRRVSAMIATGGDTAVAILNRLAQPTLTVMGNLLPGIPFSRIQSRDASLWFVTKAGGFGATETLVNIARRLRVSA